MNISNLCARHARPASFLRGVACCLSLIALMLPQKVAHAAGKFAKPLIIAYVFPGENVLQPASIAAAKLSRINYAFANIQNGRMVYGFPADAQNFKVLHTLKAKIPSLQILVSVGGWTWSGRFSDMALTPASRKVFIDSAVEFIEQNALDGLDVDWEYPAQLGNGNRFRPEDTRNYTALLRELRARFDQEEPRLHRHLYLSVAAGASPEFVANTDLAQVQRYVDTINLMAYDYYEPSSDPLAANHAPLFADPRDPKRASAAASVRAFEHAGVPPRKLVLGVPFYGHVWGHVAPKNNGLFQTGKPTSDEYAGYDAITNKMLGHGYTRYWDAAAAVPYLYNPTLRRFVSYEDPESLKRKCSFVRQHGLGGVMFWDYESDPTGILLQTLHSTLDGQQTRMSRSR